MYLDADVAAARALDYRTDRPTPLGTVAAGMAAEHKIAIDIAACAYGVAVGVRLGRTFAPPAKPRSKAWISDDYRQLTEPNRRDAAKYIRKLLKIQGAPRTIGRPYAPTSPATPASDDVRAGDPEAELAAAKRWARDIGHVASGAQRWNKRRTKP